MTSKRNLQVGLEFALKSRDEAWGQNVELNTTLARTKFDLATIREERDAFKNENEILAHAVQHAAEHHDELVQFIDDLFTIEPQLKHTLTNGVWDFERVHRAAEALRAEDALASVGYTDQCVEWPDNVTPLFPHRPDGEVA